MARPPEYTAKDAVECIQVCEPTFTTEVADRLGCSRVTALKALKTAVENGNLRMKEHANMMVFWRPCEPADE